MQLRVPHRGAAPQATNQKATLLEREVFSPSSVNPVFYKLGLQPLTELAAQIDIFTPFGGLFVAMYTINHGPIKFQIRLQKKQIQSSSQG